MASRVLMKGGIWKNTEDEILKVAVMKYGKNQWSRISSLLVRKTAKQCKARWYEWLDPSIKKTEWTRQEEEKLLHLAKIMPTQWKTIAQCLEGRTAAQCLKQYEKLLDMAQNKGETEDDPRRLRPGEIDPNPESKPAKPDPVDMDEDEKEMLSEARARLANTKGKKAKRKARERMLEEARRLASLQKRREMKAAGINVPLFNNTGGSKKKKKNRDIDLNTEIPFEKQPIPGFYDTTEEKQKSYRSGSFQPVNLNDLEGKNKGEEENRLRKLDKEKNKQLKKDNLPLYLEKINQLNKTNTNVKKSKMMLPNPQVTDEDLENLVKYGKAPQNNEGDENDDKELPTSSLISDNYFMTPSTLNPSSVVQRTPNKIDNVMTEAKNLIYLNTSSTPLAKDDPSATPLPSVDPTTVSSITPSLPTTTPNLFKTPLKTSNSNTVAFSPISQKHSKQSSSSSSTPLRDHLQINTPTNLSSSSPSPSISNKVDNFSKPTNLKNNIANTLKQKLNALPEPQYEYEIQLPSIQLNDQDEENMVEDEGLKSQNKKYKKSLLQKTLFDNRSRVLKQSLPRPLTFKSGDSNDLLQNELSHLIQFENSHFPVPSSSNAKKRKINSKDEQTPENKSEEQKEKEISQFLELEDLYLQKAKNLINEELNSSFGIDGNYNPLDLESAYSNQNLLDMQDEIDHLYENLLYDDEKKQFVAPDSSQKLDILKQEFHSYKNEVVNQSKKASTLDKKLKILHGGYILKAEQLSKEICTIEEDIQKSIVDLHCFQNLHEQERYFGPLRIETITHQLEQAEEEQRQLQRKFSTLKSNKERLHKLLNF